MKRSPLGFCALFLVLSGVSSGAHADQCQLDNEALRAMPKAQVTVTRTDGTQQTIPVKLADNFATRAAGFQHVCASVIAAEPILFVFQRERRPSFHMHNVVAPIDIAFIDKNGHIESIYAMQPYSLISLEKPLYSPKGPVVAALETTPGFYQQHAIGLDAVIRWEVLQ